MSGSLSRPALGPINGLALISCIYGLTTINPAETAWSFLTLYTTIRLLLWKEFPPIALLAMGLTWIEVHFNVFEGNNYHLQLDELFLNTGQRTFWIASSGYCCMLVGLYWGLRNSEKIRITSDQLTTAAKTINPYKVLILIVALTLLDPVIGSFFGWGSSLRQIATYFNGIKLALLTAYCLHYFHL